MYPVLFKNCRGFENLEELQPLNNDSCTYFMNWKSEGKHVKSPVQRRNRITPQSWAALLLVLQAKCQRWVSQTCLTAHLHRPKNKQHWQTGMPHPINTAARALAASREQGSAKQSGGMGKVVEGYGGVITRQREGGMGEGWVLGRIHWILLPILGLESRQQGLSSLHSQFSRGRL